MTAAMDAGSTSTPLLEITIPAALAATVARHGGREAMVECATGRRWTWTELAASVRDVARGLHAIGIRKGDRVGIWAPNCAEWTLVQLATAELGIILVNINPAYRTHELAYVLNQSGCRLLVSATVVKASDYRAMVTEVAPDAAALERTIFLGDPTWDELIAAGAEVDDAEIAAVTDALECNEAINIQYTSGTTGFPKGATLSHRNILNNGYFTVLGLSFTEQDRLVIPVPFYHCFGMVMGNLGCVSVGATMIIPGQVFDAEATLRAIQDERATAVYGVPTMFIAELNHPRFAEFDVSTLRTGVMAGSPCPVEVMNRCITQMHMGEVGICYGMTETSPVSAQTLPDDDIEHRTATVGRVHPHVEIKIVGPDGQTLERGESGEYCTRGYSIMIGYWDNPEATALAIDADGWMHTGDLAVMNPDGYVNIVGRIKDVIIRGGENVYPREIEEFLYTHPDIADVQVVGVPDPRYGEEICAWIRLADPARDLDTEAVRAFCEGRLARYKIPRYVMVVDEFPMTVTGKIRKVEMRQQSAQQLGLTQERTA